MRNVHIWKESYHIILQAHAGLRAKMGTSQTLFCLHDILTHFNRKINRYIARSMIARLIYLSGKSFDLKFYFRCRFFSFIKSISWNHNPALLNMQDTV